MKNIKIIITAVILTCALIIGCAHAIPAYAENEINVFPAVIMACDITEDSVVAVDLNGNKWAFYGVEDWSIGDIALITTDTKNTETPTDDEIIDTEYGGFVSRAVLLWWLEH